MHGATRAGSASKLQPEHRQSGERCVFHKLAFITAESGVAIDFVPGTVFIAKYPTKSAYYKRNNLVPISLENKSRVEEMRHGELWICISRIVLYNATLCID